MSEYYIYPSDELYHYGVKGMRWGHRKRQARAAYKNATNKAFDKYTRDIESVEKGYKRGQTLSKKDQSREAAIEARYKNSVAKAKSAYKQKKQNIRNEKKQHNAEIKSTANELRKKASMAEKFTYNKATYTKAAKYVVDNNMSVAEATRRAKGDAWRNTAIFVAAYGAITVASLYKR